MFTPWNDGHQMAHFTVWPSPVLCSGCGCSGPSACECASHELEDAKDEIIRLTYQLSETRSLAVYYCPEDSQKDLARDLANLDAESEDD